MTPYQKALKDCEEVESMMDSVNQLREMVKEMDQEVIEVQLYGSGFGWHVTKKDYDPSCFVSIGSTPEEALEEYEAYLCEKSDNFRMEVTGPNNYIELHHRIFKTHLKK